METALTNDASASVWDRSLYAFPAEKQQRSGPMRTVNAYAGMLRDFFGRAGKTPDQAGPQEAFAWAYGVGLSGRQPSATTVGARIACLSSYCRFLLRMDMVEYRSQARSISSRVLMNLAKSCRDICLALISISRTIAPASSRPRRPINSSRH